MTRISSAEAHRLLSQGDVDLVDVREPAEWAGGHLPGARHVPLMSLLRAPSAHLSRDRVVFVCGHGVRSVTACARSATLMPLKTLSAMRGPMPDTVMRAPNSAPPPTVDLASTTIASNPAFAASIALAKECV